MACMPPRACLGCSGVRQPSGMKLYYQRASLFSLASPFSLPIPLALLPACLAMPLHSHSPAPGSSPVAGGGFGTAIDVCTGSIKWQSAMPITPVKSSSTVSAITACAAGDNLEKLYENSKGASRVTATACACTCVMHSCQVMLLV